jgi:hypothetical protein
MTDVDKGASAQGTDPGHSVWEEARDLVARLEGSTVRRLRVESGDFKLEIERRVRAGRGPAAPPSPPRPERPRFRRVPTAPLSPTAGIPSWLRSSARSTAPPSPVRGPSSRRGTWSTKGRPLPSWRR